MIKHPFKLIINLDNYFILKLRFSFFGDIAIIIDQDNWSRQWLGSEQVTSRYLSQ